MILATLADLARFRFDAWKDGTFLVDLYTRRIARWQRQMLAATTKLSAARARAQTEIARAEADFIAVKQKQNAYIQTLHSATARAETLAHKLGELV